MKIKKSQVLAKLEAESMHKAKNKLQSVEVTKIFWKFYKASLKGFLKKYKNDEAKAKEALIKRLASKPWKGLNAPKELKGINQFSSKFVTTLKKENTSKKLFVTQFMVDSISDFMINLGKSDPDYKEGVSDFKQEIEEIKDSEREEWDEKYNSDRDEY